MDLIIGGAYQGKLTYAVEKYGLAPEDCFDLEKGVPDRKYRCYYHLEALSLRALLSWDEVNGFIASLPEDAVMISREIGSGVVPLDPNERYHREAHGALLRKLAARSNSVTRLFCGIPEALK